jgi:uncharacterized protein with beta-barrel porin domain
MNPVVAHSGNYYLDAGQFGSLAVLSQTINTTVGTKYQFSYYLSSDGMTPNEVATTIAGTTVSDLTNIPSGPYIRYTFGFNATGATTLLQIGLRDDPGFLLLDDLSAFAIPTFSAIPGLTPNQSSVAAYIDNLTISTSQNFQALLTTLSGLTVDAIPGALDQLSPLAFGQFSRETAFDNATFATQGRDDYLAGRRAGENGTFLGGNGVIDSSGMTVNDPSYDSQLATVHSRLLAWNPASLQGAVSDVVRPMLGGIDVRGTEETKKESSAGVAQYNNPWNFYVRGNGTLAQGSSQADVPRFHDTTESVELGVDYRFTPNFLVGLTGGYGHTDATLDNFGSTTTVDSYSPGFYASYANDGWYGNLQGNYVHNAYTQNRSIDFLSQTATSSPQGNEGVADLDGGYEFHQGNFIFGPLAGVQYTHLSIGSYTESGSVANLSVQNQEADSLRSRLGGRISYAFSNFGLLFHPRFDISWQHEFLDQSRGITSSFDGAGLGSFNVKTENPSRNFALADLGVDADINQSIGLFLDYLVQAGQDNYFGQSFQGGVKVGF